MIWRQVAHTYTEEITVTASQPTLTVVAGLIQRQGEILICQRRRDAAFAYKWEFPGGKVEAGESHVEGLHRELQEELGIEAQIGQEVYQTCHAYAGAHTVELFFYAVLSFSGTVRNQAFEQVRWVAPAHLPDFDFLEGDTDLITLLSQGKLSWPQSQP
jgi:8-oxo-dGTP diphosphatase